MSVKLSTQSRVAVTGSKGNQEKWEKDGRWYKVDADGYEGLAETVVSSLLKYTNVTEPGFHYVSYRMEKLDVHKHIRTGCSSENFLASGDSIITVADLLKKGIGSEWIDSINRLPNIRSRIEWLVKNVESLTGLNLFGKYLTLLFETDMLFLNEDRHLNNIAVIRREGKFIYCPFFDFGAGLLSNVRDYPMDVIPKGLASQVKARPMECGFTRQVHAAQELYGKQLTFSFSETDIDAVLDDALIYYPERDRALIRDRVKYCISYQHRKLEL